MKKIVAFLLLIPLVFGCGSESQTGIREGKGGVQLGGVFHVNEVMDMRSLNPLEITEVVGYRIASQVYQTMVGLDQTTLDPVPALAESWEPNEDATEWVFRLRKGVFFHDDPCFPDGKGREMKASDVEYCLKQLCTPSEQNQMFWLVRDRLLGAKAYYEAAQAGAPLNSLECIEVIDDYSVKIKLNFPFASFLRLMAHNAFYIYPSEAVEAYGAGLRQKAVGTGPFMLKVYNHDELVVLERNNAYWGVDKHGNQLPYLDAVQVSFVKDKKSELLSFRNGELDMVFTLPIEMYDNVMGGLASGSADGKTGFVPQVKPALSVHYYAFQHANTVFSDVRVRQAFNMAVDREALVNYTLQGEGTPGIYGIVPPVFTNYPHQDVVGTTFDPEGARALLAEAGFPDGKAFPTLTLELTSGGRNYEIIAGVIKQMLEENLNITLEMEVMTMADQSDRAEEGSAVFWRTAWLADYPDPENFLCLFLSDDMADKTSSYLNTVNFKSALYDSLYKAGIQELDDKKRFGIFAQLDQILIDEAVIMPLYYEEFTRLLPRYVKGFPQNSIEYRDFSTVWLDKDPEQSEP